MIQRREELRLPPEPSQPICVVREGIRQDFEGDLATELLVVGAVHLAHPAFAEEADDAISAEGRAGSQGHVGVPRSIAPVLPGPDQ